MHWSTPAKSWLRVVRSLTDEPLPGETRVDEKDAVRAALFGGGSGFGAWVGLDVSKRERPQGPRT